MKKVSPLPVPGTLLSTYAREGYGRKLEEMARWGEAASRRAFKNWLAFMLDVVYKFSIEFTKLATKCVKTILYMFLYNACWNWLSIKHGKK